MDSVNGLGSSDPLRKRSRSNNENLDRFIPNRSAMDFDFARTMLSGGEVKNQSTVCSPSKVAYRKLLADALNMNRTRILAFKNKPQPPERILDEHLSPTSTSQPKSVSPRRTIPLSSEKTLDALDMIDDFYLNLLDWSSSKVVVICLENSIFLWDASSGSASELFTYEDDIGPITSIR